MDRSSHESTFQVRLATTSDQDAVWEIFHQVIARGDTYVFDPTTPKQDMEQHWFAPYMKTYVLEHNQQLAGTYILKPNFIGAGSHIANASYMVHPEKQGQGMGHILCEHSIQEARRLGFLAIQFNIVVSTNQAAIVLWKKHGFAIIGTTPDGFQHPQQGLVDTHIMYKKL